VSASLAATEVPMSTVRTRFAPSPTGFLHIGGVRTALFNWLYARKHGGKFVLRIDDTDQQRNVEAALEPILHGFRWLGIDWDEGPEVGGPHGPYYQSQKLDRYQEAVRQLLDKGLAYRDYATPDELKAEREAAEKEKRTFVYNRRWMAHTAEDRARFEAEGRQAVVRLMMPREGACRIADHVRGEVVVEWATQQDQVIQRANGTVLYNLANVVDDFDMKITHVIRAEEHLPNTPQQIFMLEGLGYPRPEYAHVPFVAEPGSKNKLSKRKIAQYLKNPDFKKVAEHGQAIADRIGLKTTADDFSPVLVAFYEAVGYLPDAVVNYLLLLGWAHEDGKSEFFTRQQRVELFTLERVNKAPASFDAKKLAAFQEHYLRGLPPATAATMTLPFLKKAGLTADPAAVERVVEQALPRMSVAGDVLNYDYLFLPDEAVRYDAKAVEKHLRKAPGSEWLPRLRELLADAEPFEAATLKARVEAFAAERGAKPGPVSQTLRAAVTGQEVGFGAYETLAILGRERCLARIARALGQE
jgi:glutamyl-tRNA synthetase